MARQRSLTESTGMTIEATVKGEAPFQPSLETSRPASSSASHSIAFFGATGKTDKSRREPTRETVAYPGYRQICDDIFAELGKIGNFLVNDQVTDEGGEVVAEIEALLEQLYAYRFGQGESLKRVVVAVQSQVSNASWEKRHVEFLRDVIRFLRVRYLVDGTTVDTCYEMMRTHGLNPFRGTVSAPRVVKQYRIEEVKENEAAS